MRSNRRDDATTSTPGPAARPEPTKENEKNIVKDSASSDIRATTSYDDLPARVTSWPKAFPSNGKTGWSSPQQWSETIGKEYDLPSITALKAAGKKGDLAWTTLDQVGGEALGGISTNERTAKQAFLYNDPGVRPDPGPLVATLWVPNGKDIKSVPTRITTSLYRNDGEASDANRQVADQSRLLASVMTTPPTAVRIAWNAPNGKTRIVEYLDLKDGSTRKPTKSEDLEASPMVRATTIYSAEDQSQDLLNAVKRANQPKHAAASTPTPASLKRPPESTITGSPGKPDYKPDWLNEVAQAAAATRQSSAAQAISDSIEGSKRMAFAALTEPGLETTHIIVVKKTPSDLEASFDREGIAKIYAGIPGNFSALLPKDCHAKGLIDTGSRVFIAFREGDRISVVASAPYLGLDARGPGADVILDRTKISPLKGTFALSMSTIGMGIPNWAFTVSKHPTLSGFNVPAPARYALWRSIHENNGWETGI